MLFEVAIIDIGKETKEETLVIRLDIMAENKQEARDKAIIRQKMTEETLESREILVRPFV